MSKWTTLKSGPLAGVETEGKGRNRELCQELVVHSPEWTTSWAGNWGKGQKPGVCQELVVHSVEWTTGLAGN